MNPRPSQSEISIDNQSKQPWLHVPKVDAASVSSAAKKGVNRGVKAVQNVYTDFQEFLNRGNVFDLAIGVIMGAAFTAVVTSMVKDIFTPLISLGLDQVSLDNSFIVMACPKSNVTNSRPSLSNCKNNFTTVLQANTAGAITWNYGSFINQIITFLITSAIVFFIVKMYCAAFRRKKAEDTEKECQFCFKKVPIKATRCAFCTSLIGDSSTSSEIDVSEGTPEIPSKNSFRK